MTGYDMPSSLDELLSKDEIRESSKQNTPYNINRNFVLFIYVMLIVLTNRLFFGWPNLSNLLFRDDAYIWKCPKNSSGSYDRIPGKRYVCEDQDKAVQTIFIFGSSAYFAFSFFNGLIVDYLGSRLSVLLGHILNLVGWIILVMSGENFDGYVAGGVFMAASIDLASFATLNASGLFPGNENLIVNIISGAGSLSPGIMTILDIIITKYNFNFKFFMLCYMGISVGFFFILSIFFFPKTRYYRQYEFDNYYSTREFVLRSSLENGNSDSINEKQITSYKNASKKSKLDNIKSNKNCGFLKSKYFRDLLNIFTCAHFLCLWIYGPLNAIYNTFYYSVVENILSKEKNDLLGYILPFSVIPCIILGNLSDKFGVMIIIVYELIFALFMYGFSFFKSNIAQWASVISNVLYSSCANGQIWTFISYTFSSKYHSTLIGLLNFVCGVVSFARILLLEWAKNVNYDFTYINLLIIGFIVINAIVAIILGFIIKAKGDKVMYGDEDSD
ncbi:major facilitator superfamily-related transporter, putative [Plasmodium vinckei lentum]|uniref:Major facilitator superfamily-related transporter, putative n=1 Tax=Plasmodium vinckei lentum TaxID=138297 RepID=A0A6V7S4L5_PLAVN|nr:major facilitator superfamily-related transporter, putative [Plasmodium vinckei lentum]